MAKLNNPMEILKLLDKSNCRKCNEATCLAFAAAVSRGWRALSECPGIEEDVIKQFGDGPGVRKPPDSDVVEVLNQSKDRFRTIDRDLRSKVENFGNWDTIQRTVALLGSVGLSVSKNIPTSHGPASLECMLT